MNRADAASANGAMTAGRDIPWLQDVPGEDAWDRWGVALDELVVLDPQNRFVEVYDLFLFDLSVPANRDALKDRLRDLATH